MPIVQVQFLQLLRVQTEEQLEPNLWWEFLARACMPALSIMTRSLWHQVAPVVSNWLQLKNSTRYPYTALTQIVYMSSALSRVTVTNCLYNLGGNCQGFSLLLIVWVIQPKQQREGMDIIVATILRKIQPLLQTNFCDRKQMRLLRNLNFKVVIQDYDVKRICTSRTRLSFLFSWSQACTAVDCYVKDDFALA